MVEVVDIHESKLGIEDNFLKTPLARLNDQYFGIAWFEGEYRLHEHNVDEFLMVLEGHLSIEVENNIYELNPGMGIVIRTGERHRTKAAKRTLVGVFEPQKVTIEYLD